MPFYFEQSDFPINVALPVMTLVLDLFSGDVGARKRNNKNYQTSVLPSARQAQIKSFSDSVKNIPCVPIVSFHIHCRYLSFHIQQYICQSTDYTNQISTFSTFSKFSKFPNLSYTQFEFGHKFKSKTLIFCRINNSYDLNYGSFDRAVLDCFVTYHNILFGAQFSHGCTPIFAECGESHILFGRIYQNLEVREKIFADVTSL